MEEAPKITSQSQIPLALQSNLSRSSAYVLSLCQVKTKALQQELLMLLNSKFTCNEIKKLIKNTAYVADTLGTVFNDMGLFRVFNIVKRISDSYSNICTHVVEALEKTKSHQREQKCVEKQEEHKQNNNQEIEYKSIEQAKRQMKLNKLKGVSLYGQNYKRKIDKQIEHQASEHAKKQKQLSQKQDIMNQKQFKAKLFNKLKNQLKEVQEDLYSPSTDQISTFLVFERKFLQSFNHTSHEESVQIILNYLQNSQLSATQLLKNTQDMSEQVSKFKMQIQLLVKDVKTKNKQRNENISDKLSAILMRFARRKAQALRKTKLQLQKYKKMVTDKQGTKVSIGVQTHLKELGTLKGYEKKVNEMEEKYQTRQSQKQKAFKALLSKADEEKNTMYAELTKQKVNYKMAVQQAQQMKKQNQKFIEMLYQKKSQKRIVQRSKTKAYTKVATEAPTENQSKIRIMQQKWDEEKRGSFMRKDKRISVRLSNNFSRFGEKLEEIMHEEEEVKPKSKKYVSIAEIQNDSRTMTRIEKRNQLYSEEKSRTISNYASQLNIKQQTKLKGNSLVRIKTTEQLQTNYKPKSAFNLKDLQNCYPDQNKHQYKQKKDLIARYAHSKKRIEFYDEKQQLKKQNRLKNQNTIAKIRNGKKQNQLQISQQKSYLDLPVRTEQNESQQSISMEYKDKYSILKTKNNMRALNNSQQNTKKLQKHDKKESKSLHEKPVVGPNNKYQKTKANFSNLNSNSNSRLPSVNKQKIVQLLKPYKNSSINKLYQTSKPNQSSSLSIMKGTLVALDYNQVYSISLNNGQVTQFYEQVQEAEYEVKRKQLSKMLKYKNKYIAGHLSSENLEKAYQSGQIDNHPITFDRQIIRQLKLYDKLCNKRQFLGNNHKSVHEETKNTPLKDMNLINFENSKQRSFSNQQKNYEMQNSNDIFKIKSLTRDGKLIQFHPQLKQNLSLHKKILHQIQLQWLKNRNQPKEISIFNVKQQSIHAGIMRSKSKYVPSQALRKVRRNKQEFTSIYKKMQYRDPIYVAVPLGLPQIKTKVL